MVNFDLIAKEDPQIADLMKLELKRQQQHLELIASENMVSDAVMEAMGSHGTNKYAEGYPGKRYYGGCQYVDGIETLAIERLKELFGADHANVQPHSGASANAAVYLAVLQPGDKILGLDLSHGGHLTHGAKVNSSGKLYESHFYGLDPETELIDYDLMREKALEIMPKLIVSGASAYPRIIDFKKIREICDEVGAVMLVDMAHIAGLVAAGLHPNPVEYADIVTSTTHKTLRGPRGGIILCKEEYAKKIYSESILCEYLDNLSPNGMPKYLEILKDKKIENTYIDSEVWDVDIIKDKISIWFQFDKERLPENEVIISRDTLTKAMEKWYEFLQKKFSEEYEEIIEV